MQPKITFIRQEKRQRNEFSACSLEIRKPEISFATLDAVRRCTCFCHGGGQGHLEARLPSRSIAGRPIVGVSPVRVASSRRRRPSSKRFFGWGVSRPSFVGGPALAQAGDVVPVTETSDSPGRGPPPGLKPGRPETIPSGRGRPYMVEAPRPSWRRAASRLGEWGQTVDPRQVLIDEGVFPSMNTPVCAWLEPWIPQLSKSFCQSNVALTSAVTSRRLHGQ